VGSEEVKQIVLAQIGLTDDELRDFLRKLDGFYVSLTPKERKVFRSGTRAGAQEVAKAFGGKITARELEEFIKSREPKDVPLKPIMVFECSGGGDDDDEKKKQ
jgi:hypothetical protein